MRHLRSLFLALPVALAACGENGGGLDIQAPSFAGPTKSAPETIAVAGGDIVIAGPSGYCIDRGASRPRGQTAFVLLGSCASVSSNDAMDSPAAPGLLTASVDSVIADAPDTATLLEFLSTNAGRATLARDGLASSVTIIEAKELDGAVLVNLRDTSPNPTAGLENRYWRGLLFLNQRLITVTVVGFESRPLDSNLGLNKLRNFIARIREETPERAKVATPEPRTGLFRRIVR